MLGRVGLRKPTIPFALILNFEVGVTFSIERFSGQEKQVSAFVEDRSSICLLIEYCEEIQTD